MPQELPSPLSLITGSYIMEACPDIRPDLFAAMLQIISHLWFRRITYERASEIFMEKVGTSSPVVRIDAIMNVGERPIDLLADRESLSSGRRQSHSWSEYEDQRLLCGITRFGLDNWSVVAEFVGNRRTRAQCAQRWFRGLDPRISKMMWTQGEEERLLYLVRIHGTRSWTRIAAEIGNRSDAQCRYHYMQMVKRSEIDDAPNVMHKACESDSESRQNRREGVGVDVKSLPELAPRKALLPSIASLTGIRP
jgi:hypothetical protein